MNLQSRDPFSGDCDGGGTGRFSSRGTSARLAEPRPVLRGLRLSLAPRFHLPDDPHQLAEPRPVLRGLRQKEGIDPLGRLVHSCRAETRSQGIAMTAVVVKPPGVWRHPPCRAETRSQGIAIQGQLSHGEPPGDDQLAEPRPVLRGLRYASGPRGGREKDGPPCRAETRSQGIAMPTPSWREGDDPPSALQSRDPFSGDCDQSSSVRSGGNRRASTCRAETRSQGIAMAFTTLCIS